VRDAVSGVDLGLGGKQHVRNGVISFATEKSQGRTTVHLPMLDVLKKSLDVGQTASTSPRGPSASWSNSNSEHAMH
jgi:hypothetical protein